MILAQASAKIEKSKIASTKNALLLPKTRVLNSSKIMRSRVFKIIIPSIDKLVVFAI